MGQQRTNRRRKTEGISNSLLASALTYAERGWQVFPLDGKRPIRGTHGHRDATTNPKQIRRWWKTYPDANVGIRCDSRTGPIVLDIDDLGVAQEHLATLKLPRTLIACSREGRFHYYFSPNGQRVRRRIKFLPGLDLLGDGGYVVAPPSIHPETGERYYWQNTDEPAELPKSVNRLMREKTKASDAQQVGDRMPETIREGQRDDLLTSLAGSMRRRGASPSAILAALRAENEARCDPPLSDRQLAKIAKSIGAKPAGSDGDTTLRGMNERYAVVRRGPNVQILEERAGGSYELLQKKAFDQWYANKYLTVGAQDGESKQVPLNRAWFTWSGRREYRLVFKPGVYDVPSGEWNRWRGWAVEPNEDEALAEPFLYHLREHVCGGNERHYKWLVNWLAGIFQQPMRKPGTAVVLRGGQGVGKTIVGVVIGKLIGSHYQMVDKPEQFAGRFNDHIEELLLLQSDEAFWAGDKKGAGTLKSLVTATELSYEPKGLKLYKGPNYTRLLFTSNEDWVIPAGLDERRFAVFDVKDTVRQDHEFFGNMIAGLEADNDAGYGALLHYLLTHPYSESLARKIPQTAALREQQLHSLDPMYQWWINVVRSGELPTGDTTSGGDALVITSALLADYVESARLAGAPRRKSETELGIFLKRFGCRRVNRRVWDPVQGNRRRAWGYEVPSPSHCAHVFQTKGIRVKASATTWRFRAPPFDGGV